MDFFDRSAFSQRLIHDKMPFARWCDQKLKEFLLCHRIEIFCVAQAVTSGFQTADSFLERLFIGFSNAHHFPDRTHLGTEFIFHAFELLTHRHTQQNLFIQGLYSTLKVPASLVVKIVTKGMPLLLNETLWAAGMAMLTQCYSIRGLNVIAALNISNTINNVFNIVFIALGESVAIIVGQLLGAGKMAEAKDTDNKMIAFSVFSCTLMAIIMLLLAQFFPLLYNTNAEARALATRFIMLTALFMPQNAFLHASYFTLRSGGKTIITFLFDSVFIWCVSVTIAFILSRYTALPVIAVYAFVQMGDWIKCVIGFVLVKKGIWLQNIVS